MNTLRTTFHDSIKQNRQLKKRTWKYTLEHQQLNPFLSRTNSFHEQINQYTHHTDESTILTINNSTLVKWKNIKRVHLELNTFCLVQTISDIQRCLKADESISSKHLNNLSKTLPVCVWPAEKTKIMEIWQKLWCYILYHNYISFSTPRSYPMKNS